MNDTVRPVDRMGQRISSPTLVFKKVLQAFKDGDLPYADVQSDLQRLLENGASPEDLRDVLRTAEAVEPLPDYVHTEILRILNKAAERAHAQKPAAEPAASTRQGERSADRAAARAEARARADNATPLEERLARNKAEYEALNRAYERALDAGSTAAARTVTLAADVAAARTALEVEQSRTRDLEQALAAARASDKAACDALAAREQALDALRRSVGEGEAQSNATRLTVAAAQRDLATAQKGLATAQQELAAVREELLQAQREAATLREGLASAQRDLASTQRELASAEGDPATRRELDAARQELTMLRRDFAASKATLATRDAALAPLQAEVSAERARSATLSGQVAEARAALEAARARQQNIQSESERFQSESRSARDALEAERRSHAAVVAELQAKVEAFQVHPSMITAEVSPLGDAEAERLLDPRLERGAAQLAADWRGAAPQWESGTAAAGTAAHPTRFEAQQTEPISMLAIERPMPAPVNRHPVRRPWPPRLIAGGFAVVVGLGLFLWMVASHHNRTPAAAPAGAFAAASVPKPGSQLRDCAACPAVTVVPAGRFKQGSVDAKGPAAAFERPVHEVTIAHPFAISTNPVTVDEFRAFIAATGRNMRGCEIYDEKWRFRPESNWENPGYAQTGAHPVTCVSWSDAKAYAAWLSTTTGHQYRLPSATEWEYAARAGGEAVLPWNADGSGACANANVADRRAAHRYPGWSVFACDDGFVYTAPVGSFKANAFGLNDMLGNVVQWTDDCWHADYTGAPEDGSSRTYGNCAEHELRGGSWYSTPEFVRASYRNHFPANYRASSVGIRVVRELP